MRVRAGLPALAVLALPVLLAACQAAKGAGQDINQAASSAGRGLDQAGHAIANTADHVKQDICCAAPAQPAPPAAGLPLR